MSRLLLESNPRMIKVMDGQLNNKNLLVIASIKVIAKFKDEAEHVHDEPYSEGVEVVCLHPNSGVGIHPYRPSLWCPSATENLNPSKYSSPPSTVDRTSSTDGKVTKKILQSQKRSAMITNPAMWKNMRKMRAITLWEAFRSSWTTHVLSKSLIARAMWGVICRSTSTSSGRPSISISFVEAQWEEGDVGENGVAPVAGEGATEPVL